MIIVAKKFLLNQSFVSSVVLRVRSSVWDPKVSAISRCVYLKNQLCACFTGVPEFPQARSDAHAVVEANEGGATPGAPSVTQGDQDKDGSLNVRKRRALEEGGGTVKVRRKGSGASEGTEQVCGELNDFYQQVTNVACAATRVLRVNFSCMLTLNVGSCVAVGVRKVTCLSILVH